MNYIISHHWQIKIKSHVLVLQQITLKSFRSVQTGSLSAFSSRIKSPLLVNLVTARLGWREGTPRVQITL